MTRTLKIKTNFLDYHRVKARLKKNFSIHLQDPIVKPVWPTTIEILTKSKKGSKDFYKLLTNTSQLHTLSYKSKWEVVVGDKLDHEDWKTIYKHCFKVIQDNEIIWLQYRIINRILGTKSLLFKIKNSNNNLCRFCTNSPKTISHVFIQCSILHEFWQKIKLWVHDSIGLSFSLNAKTVLLGLVDKKQLEIIFLLAKLYIYKGLVNNTPPTFTAFQKFFKRKYEEQQYLAIISLTDQKFRSSWRLLSLLPQNI